MQWSVGSQLDASGMTVSVPFARMRQRVSQYSHVEPWKAASTKRQTGDQSSS